MSISSPWQVGGKADTMWVAACGSLSPVEGAKEGVGGGVLPFTPGWHGAGGVHSARRLSTSPSVISLTHGDAQGLPERLRTKSGSLSFPLSL